MMALTDAEMDAIMELARPICQPLRRVSNPALQTRASSRMEICRWNWGGDLGEMPSNFGE
jgi:hypothetical protein